MEDIDQRLETLSSRRQKQFQNITQKEIAFYFGDCNKSEKEKILQHTKEKIIQFMNYEKKEKFVKRKHGSKGENHRERGPQQIERILEKLSLNEINYPLMFKELFNITLREKRSYEGIGYIGLCPLHDEKTPSLHISLRKGVVKCFGCGRGGSAIGLIEHGLKKTFSETLGLLEKYIHTPEETQDLKTKNQEVQETKARTAEQEEKRKFIRSLQSREYLPKKEFEAEFAKRKEQYKESNKDLPF